MAINGHIKGNQLLNWKDEGSREEIDKYGQLYLIFKGSNYLNENMHN